MAETLENFQEKWTVCRIVTPGFSWAITQSESSSEQEHLTDKNMKKIENDGFRASPKKIKTSLKKKLWNGHHKSENNLKPNIEETLGMAKLKTPWKLEKKKKRRLERYNKLLSKLKTP